MQHDVDCLFSQCTLQCYVHIFEAFLWLTCTPLTPEVVLCIILKVVTVLPWASRKISQSRQSDAIYHLILNKV